MPRADWRSPAAYEDKRSLDAPGFAWEVLRRNPEFQREHQRLSRAFDRDALTPKQLEAFARRWGVRFREAHARLRKRCDPLDGDGPSECRCPDTGAQRDCQSCARRQAARMGRCACRRWPRAFDHVLRRRIAGASSRRCGCTSHERRASVGSTVRGSRGRGASTLARTQRTLTRPRSGDPSAITTRSLRPLPACARCKTRARNLP